MDFKYTFTTLMIYKTFEFCGENVFIRWYKVKLSNITNFRYCDNHRFDQNVSK